MEGAPAPIARGERRRWLAVVVTGAYCWAVTVLPGMQQAGLRSLAFASGALALVILCASLAAPDGRWFRALSLDGFLAAALLSWWFAGPLHADRSFAAFGALGILAYTFALGALSTPRALSAFAVDEARFSARTPPRRLPILLMVVIVPVTALLLALAWRVERLAAGVLAHVLALAAALLLLRSAALLAESLQTQGTRLHRAPSLRRAVWPLLALGLLVGLALVSFWIDR